MNLTIDIGNTQVKWAVFDGEQIKGEGRAERSALYDVCHQIAQRYNVQHGIYATVVTLSAEEMEQLHSLPFTLMRFTYETPIPVRNLYRTPQTLGMDRLAAVIGAWSILPDTPLLIIDAGTAITYDFLNERGEYIGGNISPGIEMRFKALHAFSSQLPLVEKEGDTPDYGYNTETALRSGVVQGVQWEIEGYIRKLQYEHPRLFTFLTGGDAFFFDYTAKKQIFADSFLVLKGLNRVLNDNIQE